VFCDVIEITAAGCLATTFGWLQHQLFLLVFGSRPAIKADLMRLLARPATMIR
jgi:hypothetical protein